MISYIEIGDNINIFNSLNNAQIEKKYFWNALRALFIFIIAYLFPKFFKNMRLFLEFFMEPINNKKN